MRWTEENLPDLTGQMAVVTGANSGLGFEMTRALAAQGCEVIMACRNLEKALVAQDKIKKIVPQANLKIEQLNLSSLTSIQVFCERMKASHSRVRFLINNAAELNVPLGSKTEDGFNLIMGTNHLGTFALTAQLMPLLETDPHARIVTVTSDSTRFTHFNLSDLADASKYTAIKAYEKSKCANLLSSFELAN